VENSLRLIDRPVLIFSGNFGSGKSEVAVNVAFALAEQGRTVSIVDLDVVNPYFRCREAREDLEAKGVSVVAPTGEFAWADLPVVMPEVKGTIQARRDVVILDVGGDDLGARALSSIRGSLTEGSYHFCMVLNASRPFTNDFQSSCATIERIEDAAQLQATALIGNTHLMEYTTLDTIVDGYELLDKVAQKRNLPVLFVTAECRLADDVATRGLGCPVFSLTRWLRPPWLEMQRAEAQRVGTPQPGRPVGKPPSVELPGLSGKD